jgi:2,3-bisphosphoglycerate-dependent phosphoglycerate mutase
MKKITILLVCLFSIAIYSQNNTTKIIIVRHAEKADDGTKNPPLLPEGIARAGRLSVMLSDLKIDKLYATDFLRTQQTLTPLSKKFNIAITTYDASDVAFAEQLLLKEKGKTIVISGHSNSSPTLVNRLIKKEVYQKLDESVYSKIWILTFKDDELIDCSLLNY